MKFKGISDQGFSRLAKVIKGQGMGEYDEIGDLQRGISQVGLYYDFADDSAATNILADHFADPENWVIMEGGGKWGESLMDKINMEAIRGTMTPYESKSLPNGDIAYKASDGNGELNAAGVQLQDIVAALADYPLLDDEAYSNAQMDQALDSIESNGWGLVDEAKAPENWPNEVWTWLWENNQMALEGNNQGEIDVEEKDIKEALQELGWLMAEEEEY